MTLIDDQSDLRRRLEATSDLVDAGVPLGEISARAAAAERCLTDLRNEVARILRETHPAATHLHRALLAWAESVNEWIGHALDQCSGSAQRSSTLPRDATTAALERAGEALAERQQTEQAAAPETCKRCKKPITVNGHFRTCVPCSTSWMVPEKREPCEKEPCSTCHTFESPFCSDAYHLSYAPEKREPLAQSAWVPEQTAPAEESTIAQLRERVRELEVENSVAVDALTGARARATDLEREVDSLKVVNAMQAPAERSAHADAVVMRMRKLVETASNRNAGSYLVANRAEELMQELRDCESGGWLRIEFSVKEVLP